MHLARPEGVAFSQSLDTGRLAVVKTSESETTVISAALVTGLPQVAKASGPSSGPGLLGELWGSGPRAGGRSEAGFV